MNDSNNSGGISFLGLLTIVFITLKLTNVILWSWVYVLLPLLIPIALVIIGLIVIGICKIVEVIIDKSVKQIRKRKDDK